MERARRTELDGLRGLAALIVLVAHVSNEVGLWGGLIGHGAGKVGVMIFFCLSGYLMGTLYLNRPPRPEEIFRYGLHRMSRIAPLYYALVFASLATGLIFANAPLYGVDSENLLQHVAFIRAVDVLWTIPVEVQFYAAFILLWLVRSVSRPAFMLLCAAAIPLLWVKTDDAENIGATLLAWAPYFLLGLLVSCLPERDAQSPAADWFWTFAFLASAAATTILFPQVAFNIGGLDFMDKIQIHPWHNRWSYLIVTILLASTLRAPLAKHLLGSAPMVYAGAISYSVYLLHYPVMGLLNVTTRLAQWPEIYLLATTLLTGLVASASFYWFEDPMRRRLNAFAARFQHAPTKAMERA